MCVFRGLFVNGVGGGGGEQALQLIPLRLGGEG